MKVENCLRGAYTICINSLLHMLNSKHFTIYFVSVIALRAAQNDDAVQASLKDVKRRLGKISCLGE